MSDAELTAAAQNILRTNDRGGYTVPVPGLYPFQWNWDSALNALGWAELDEPRAWLELQTLFSGQWPDGMVPHIIFHQYSPTYFPGPDAWRTGREPSSSGITQPPVAATAVRKLYERCSDKDAAAAEIATLLPKLFAYHQWFRTARDPDSTGLVAVLHPWESGWDNSPAWDDAMAAVPTEGVEPFERKDTTHVNAQHRPTQKDYERYMAIVQAFRKHDYDPNVLYRIAPFCVRDLCVNSILLRADEDLIWLAETFGHPAFVGPLTEWRNRGVAAFETLWDADEGYYRSFDVRAGALVGSESSAAFLAFFGGVVPSHRTPDLINSYDRFRATVSYGVPTYPRSGAKFDPKRYWRGPLWPIVNYLICDGLRRYGFDDRADTVADDTRAVIAQSGFYEYFDPLDGSGLGADEFSWTAAMWLAWLAPAGPR